VETLEQHGLHVKLGTFRKYLYRYRRNLKTSADEETKAPPPEPAPQATAAVAGQIRNKGDLTRARDVDFDLDQLAEAAKDKEQ
jgi:hypothetical protein